MAVHSYTATKNAALKSTSPTTNFSSDTQNRIYHNAANDAFEYIAFFFNVNPLTAHQYKKLVGASLDLYVVSKSGDSDATIAAEAFEASWNEASITYNNKPSTFLYVLGAPYAGLSVGWNNIGIGIGTFPSDFVTTQYGFLLKISDNPFVVDSNTSVMIQTLRGTNKPTLKIETESVSLAIGNRLPSGGFVYRGADKVFSWTATNPDAASTFGTVAQASAKLRYRKVGGSTTEISISGATNSYTIAANTLDGASNYEWQVAVTSNDGVETTSSWIQFSTTDSTPGKPTITAPVNSYEITDAPITFEWAHNINTGTPQSKADLQYSYNGGSWTTLATVTGSAHTYAAAANTITPGANRWRVRTYNTDNVAGDWSDPAAFVGVGATAAPTISAITPSSRPAISWQSVGQVGYELEITQAGARIYATGETAGGAKSLTLPLYLANGTYTLRIRVVSASLLWSAWTQLDFTVAVTPPTPPTVTAVAITNGARITITGGGTVAHAYLLRDGVVVADVTGLSTYDDYTAVGSTGYVVRVVDSSERYADSVAAWVTVSATAAVLAAVDALDAPVSMSKKDAGQPPLTGQIQYGGSMTHYAGREFPVYTASGFTDETHNAAYYYTSRADWARLRAMLDRRKPLLYRDILGNRFFCAATAVSIVQDDYKVMFSLSLSRIDYVEQIDYAGVSA